MFYEIGSFLLGFRTIIIGLHIALLIFTVNHSWTKCISQIGCVHLWRYTGFSTIFRRQWGWRFRHFCSSMGGKIFACMGGGYGTKHQKTAFLLNDAPKVKSKSCKWPHLDNLKDLPQNLTKYFSKNIFRCIIRFCVFLHSTKHRQSFERIEHITTNLQQRKIHTLEIATFEIFITTFNFESIQLSPFRDFFDR